MSSSKEINIILGLITYWVSFASFTIHQLTTKGLFDHKKTIECFHLVVPNNWNVANWFSLCSSPAARLLLHHISSQALLRAAPWPLESHQSQTVSTPTASKTSQQPSAVIHRPQTHSTQQEETCSGHSRSIIEVFSRQVSIKAVCFQPTIWFLYVL